jgi:putative solute:sodium symporter small subunit
MPEIHTPSAALQQKQSRLKWTLLLIWLCVSFGPSFFARNLAMEVNGWPVYFWMAAQGSVLVFVAIVVIYAWLMNRWEAEEATNMSSKENSMHEKSTLRTD